jgi:hypothetical protein
MSFKRDKKEEEDGEFFHAIFQYYYSTKLHENFEIQDE